MAKSLPARRTETDICVFFYPGQGSSQHISRTTKRRPKFLVALDDQAYWEMSRCILKTPRLRFLDIHQLLNLSQADGQVLVQVMNHVVSWSNPNPTPVTDQRNNKKPALETSSAKPALRNDLVSELQHSSAQFVRLTEKKLYLFLWNMTLESPPENASVLLQQEIHELTRARLKVFKAPAMKRPLNSPGAKTTTRVMQNDF
jgi:hypothetical protein